MSFEEITVKGKNQMQGKMGLHKDIVAPFIGLVTISTIAWVTTLILLGRD